MAYEIHRERCPYCGAQCECDLVDNGVGFVQCGPFHCENCRASEIHSSERPIMMDVKSHTTPTGRVLTESELRTGWYEPETPVSPMANTVCGKLVDHKMAQKMYRIGLLDEKPDVQPQA